MIARDAVRDPVCFARRLHDGNAGGEARDHVRIENVPAKLERRCVEAVRREQQTRRAAEPVQRECEPLRSDADDGGDHPIHGERFPDYGEIAVESAAP